MNLRRTLESSRQGELYENQPYDKTPRIPGPPRWQALIQPAAPDSPIQVKRLEGDARSERHAG